MGSVGQQLRCRDILDQLIQAAFKVSTEPLKDVNIEPLGGFMVHPCERSAIQSGIARDIRDLEPTLAQNAGEMNFDHRGNKKLFRRSF